MCAVVDNLTQLVCRCVLCCGVLPCDACVCMCVCSENEVGAEGATSLAKAVKACTQLRSLNLSGECREVMQCVRM